MSGALLVKAAQVLDAASPHHQSRVDLLLHEGRVTVNPGEVPKDAQLLQEADLCVSPGWVDIGTGITEPGFEQRETLEETLESAIRGGFTHVLAMPFTNPVVDHAGMANAVLRLGERVNCGLSLIGALSTERAGKQLASMGELVQAGLTHFGDGLAPVEDAKLLQLGLQYGLPLGATVVSSPGQRRLSEEGQMNEGEVSTLLGLRGIPEVAEHIGLARDLSILRYAGGRLLVHGVSTPASVAAVKQARGEGLAVSCSVPVLNLLLSEEALLGYDVTAKVRPPLRDEETRLELIEAIRRGDVDALVSNHHPLQLEEKLVEFGYASFGAATLERTFGFALAAVGDVAVVADYLGRRNRATAGLPPQVIGENASELTFFSPTQSERPTQTPAANVPLKDKSYTGRVVATYRDGALNLLDTLN